MQKARLWQALVCSLVLCVLAAAVPLGARADEGQEAPGAGEQPALEEQLPPGEEPPPETAQEEAAEQQPAEDAPRPGPEEDAQDELPEGPIDIYTAQDLRTALANLQDADVLVLHADIEMGAQATGDGEAAVPLVPAVVAATITADEAGPYEVLRTDGERHMAMEGGRTSLAFAGVTLAGNGTGGGVEIRGGEVHLQGLALRDCAAVRGGAVEVLAGSLLLEDVALRANKGEEGGGVYLWPGAALQLQGCEVYGNTATAGGGVYLADYGALRADAATRFGENEAAVGYALEDDALRAEHDDLIAATAFSGGYACAYNNHDVNYAPPASQQEAPPAPAAHETGRSYGPTRRDQREAAARAEMGAGYGYAPEPGRRAPATALSGDEETVEQTAYSGEERPAQTQEPARPAPAAQSRAAALAVRLQPLPLAQGATGLHRAEEEPPQRSWAVLSLLFAIAGLTMGALVLIGLVAHRSAVVCQPHKLRALWRADKLGTVLGLVAALLGAVCLLWLALQNLSGPLQWADGWTPLAAAVLVAQLAIVGVLRLNGQTVDSPGRYWSGSLQGFSWESAE